MSSLINNNYQENIHNNEHSKIFDVKSIGPGGWYMIHLLAANAITYEDRLSCLFMFKVISTKFICLSCREHFREYCEKDSPEQYCADNKQLFYWTWKCHNNANLLTNKTIFSYEEAEALYLDPNLECKSGCGNQNNIETNPITTYQMYNIDDKITLSPYVASTQYVNQNNTYQDNNYYQNLSTNQTHLLRKKLPYRMRR
jgi:hypothetical protein